MIYHFIPINMAVIKKQKQKQKIRVGEGMEKLEPLCRAGWKHQMVQYYGNSILKQSISICSSNSTSR